MELTALPEIPLRVPHAADVALGSLDALSQHLVGDDEIRAGRLPLAKVHRL